jgi:hypothetical protein
MRADSRHGVLFGASMDRAVFSDHIVVSNLDPGGRLRIKAEILWVRANHASISDPIVFADDN